MVAVVTAACDHPPASLPAVTGSAVHHVNPANIKRVGRKLPPGYEVNAVADVAGPPATWSLAKSWTADPPQCAALAAPAGGHGQPGQGVAGSGAGGIVYAVVTAAPGARVSLDPALVASCAQWTMTDGRATARVHLTEAPQIADAQTAGMTSNTTTSVEGGNEIDSRADTFTAYLGGYYAFTVLVSDPGSPHPPLPPRVAADLLVTTVSELRR
jgi:hypothetical protein